MIFSNNILRCAARIYLKKRKCVLTYFKSIDLGYRKLQNKTYIYKPASINLEYLFSRNAISTNYYCLYLFTIKCVYTLSTMQQKM